MILINLKKNKNEKMPNAFGKYYAFPVINQTIGMDGLSEHMASHNTPFSAGAIKGMLTDLVSCIRELTLQGIAVKIDNLAIFSIGIKNKCGAASEKDFSVAKNIESVKLRARATGVLMSDRLKLDATIKRASAILGDDSSNGENAGGGSVNGDAGGSGVNKPSAVIPRRVAVPLRELDLRMEAAEKIMNCKT